MNSQQVKRFSAVVSAVACLLVLLGVSCTLQPPLKNLANKTIKVTGGGIVLSLHSLSARVTDIVHEESGRELLRPWPDKTEKAWFTSSITDGLTGRTFNPLSDSVLVLGFQEADEKVVFDKLLLPDGYRVTQSVTGMRDGVYLDYDLVMSDEEAPLRSLDFSFMLPIPRGTRLWVPGLDMEGGIDGHARRRFIYGPGTEGSSRIRIPLITFWSTDGPAYTLAVPLELPVVRVIFEIEPSLAPAGTTPRIEECDWLKITFDLVGASGSRHLGTRLWFYANDPGWRGALRVFAEKYRDYFDGQRRIALAESPIGSLGPDLLPAWQLTQLQNEGVKTVRFDWSTFRSGEWVPPQALRFDDFTWRSTADSSYGEISVNRVRAAIDNLIQFKIRAVLDGAWNRYCGSFNAESAYGQDIAVDESGEPLSAGDDRLLMYADSTSPFGRAMLEQQRRMLELYPQALGYYFGDWSGGGIDFGHDDSLTVVHNHAAADLAANRLRVGGKLISTVSNGRKLTITSPPERVVEGKGIDMYCFSGTDAKNLPGAALLGLWRPVISDPGKELETLPGLELENLLREKLFNGVIASYAELKHDAVLGRAFGPLFGELAGRQWRLEPVDIELPRGVDAQVFQEQSSRAGADMDLVLCLVQEGVVLADESPRPGGKVTLAFEGADRYNQATWLAASRFPHQVPLRVSPAGEQRIEISLPPFGPVGILRLIAQ